MFPCAWLCAVCIVDRISFSCNLGGIPTWRLWWQCTWMVPYLMQNTKAWSLYTVTHSSKTKGLHTTQGWRGGGGKCPSLSYLMKFWVGLVILVTALNVHMCTHEMCCPSSMVHKIHLLHKFKLVIEVLLVLIHEICLCVQLCTVATTRVSPSLVFV